MYRSVLRLNSGARTKRKRPPFRFWFRSGFRFSGSYKMPIKTGTGTVFRSDTWFGTSTNTTYYSVSCTFLKKLRFRVVLRTGLWMPVSQPGRGDLKWAKYPTGPIVIWWLISLCTACWRCQTDHIKVYCVVCWSRLWPVIQPIRWDEHMRPEAYFPREKSFSHLNRDVCLSVSQGQLKSHSFRWDCQYRSSFPGLSLWMTLYICISVFNRDVDWILRLIH